MLCIGVNHTLFCMSFPQFFERESRVSCENRNLIHYSSLLSQGLRLDTRSPIGVEDKLHGYDVIGILISCSLLWGMHLK